tara:strand:+ start:130 stop:702 length:573 start_codon:yes stop_codon:yes gene_type:complete
MAVTINGNGSVTGLSTTITNVVLEDFFYPCNGETVTTSAGNITLPNVTEFQAGTTTYVDMTGSTIAYTPPANTKTVIYKLTFQHSKVGDSYQLGFWRFYIDSDEVTKAFCCHSAQHVEGPITFEWPIRIGGTADTTTGRVASWSSSKTLKLQYRDYSNSNDTMVHSTTSTDGTNDDTFVMPRIGITALTT